LQEGKGAFFEALMVDFLADACIPHSFNILGTMLCCTFSASFQHFREEEPISELSWVARTESTLEQDEYDIIWERHIGNGNRREATQGTTHCQTLVLSTVRIRVHCTMHLPWSTESSRTRVVLDSSFALVPAIPIGESGMW
jgi:hypothetical protein